MLDKTKRLLLRNQSAINFLVSFNNPLSVSINFPILIFLNSDGNNSHSFMLNSQKSSITYGIGGLIKL